MNANGSNQRRLTNHPAGEYWPSWTGGGTENLKKIPANVAFFISTLLFAGLSVLSLFSSFRSFFKPVKKLDRIYAVILSSACFGMTMYLAYWGIIGLRVWAY